MTSTRPPAAGPTEACRNCETPRLGSHCHGCGQRFLGDRLTLGALGRHLAEQFRLERGILRMLIDMTKNPGRAIRAYVSGSRRRYVNPVTYLFFGAALSLLALRLQRGVVEAWLQGQSGEVASAAETGLTAAQAEAFNRLLLGLIHQTAATGVVICVAFALLVRLLFYRSINLPEAAVFALFTFGQIFILSAFLSIPVALGVGSFQMMIWTVLLPYLGVAIYAGVGYFGRPITTAIKMTVALVVSYGLFLSIAGVAILRYVLATVD